MDLEVWWVAQVNGRFEIMSLGMEVSYGVRGVNLTHLRFHCSRSCIPENECSCILPPGGHTPGWQKASVI